MYDLRLIGWKPIDIAIALTISRATVERLTTPPIEPHPGRTALNGLNQCCHISAGIYCNRIIATPGEVFCDKHRSSGWKRKEGQIP